MIRENAKKIGVAQRKYLKCFFQNLFSEGGDCYQSVEKSIINAKDQYNNEYDIRL
jgi:hypothetical protein